MKPYPGAPVWPESVVWCIQDWEDVVETALRDDLERWNARHEGQEWTVLKSTAWYCGLCSDAAGYVVVHSGPCPKGKPTAWNPPAEAGWEDDRERWIQHDGEEWRVVMNSCGALPAEAEMASAWVEDGFFRCDRCSGPSVSIYHQEGDCPKEGNILPVAEGWSHPTEALKLIAEEAEGSFWVCERCSDRYHGIIVEHSDECPKKETP